MPNFVPTMFTLIILFMILMVWLIYKIVTSDRVVKDNLKKPRPTFYPATKEGRIQESIDNRNK